jgi:hypothetical protein
VEGILKLREKSRSKLRGIRPKRLNQIQIGKTTPADLQSIFKNKASLKEKGSGYEVWEVAKPGDLDVGTFLLWGQVDHDKDQSLLFNFENGVLTSYNSAVTN